MEKYQDEIDAFRREHSPHIELLGEQRIRAYVRVSSKSIGQDQRRQLAGFQEFCEGTKLTDRMTYLEIASGRGGVIREKYHDMESDAKANKFDILWVEQPSRLGRDVRTGLNNMYDLASLGIKVYFQKFNKIFDMKNGQDKMLFIFYMMAAETESDWNSANTKNSNKAKHKMLQIWADENGLGRCEIGGGKSFATMQIQDPLYKGNENKKGLCIVEVPHMEEMFTMYHMSGKSNSYLANTFRQPVNQKCGYECWNGKEMPFNSMPRLKGNRKKGTKRLTRAEVAKFITKGGWGNYIKSDAEVKKTHPEAFTTKSGQARKKRTCNCGQPMSLATVCTHIKRLCYDTGIEEKRSPYAFERAEADSTELNPEQISALIMAGKVNSG